MVQRPILVAVYGTLKKNQANHHLLAGQVFVDTCTLTDITLYDLGPFPAAKLQASQGITAEVYLIDAETLMRLDQLEGYDQEQPEQGLYNRVLVTTPYGEAWVYVYNDNVDDLPAITKGGWVPA